MFSKLKKWFIPLAVMLVATAVVSCAQRVPTTPTSPTTEKATTGGDIDDIPRTTTRHMALNGAGATFPYPLYSKFIAEYHKLNPGIEISYVSIGSGGGIRQLIEKTVDFGASDAPMNDEEEATAGACVVHIPMAMGAVVPTYNLPENPELRFSPETLVGIFLGKTTKWNAPAIQEDNPGVDLPNTGIAVVHRSDGSGTTFNWTLYLSRVSQEWQDQIGVGKVVDWPVGIGAKGNEGVASQVCQTPGAIGYVELAYVQENNLPVPQVKNRDGYWVTPNLETVSKSATGMIEAGEYAEDMKALVANAPGKDSYPASATTWLLIYRELGMLPQMNLARAQELIRYILWCLDADGGQQCHANLGYAPLDAQVLEMAKENLKSVTFKGMPVWETFSLSRFP